MWQDRIKADEIIVSWEANPVSFQFESMFPYKRIKGLKFSFIKGAHGTPVALVSAGFNTNVLYRDRIGFEELTGSMPFFKEAYNIDEETRQELNSVKDEYTDILLSRIFDDTDNLLTSAEVTAERMRAQLVGTGTISIVENGVDKQYDYGFDTSKQYKDLTATGYWSVKDVKPLASLQEQIEAYYTKNNEYPTNMILSQKVFNLLRKDSEVLAYFKSLSNPILYPNATQIQNYVESLFDIKLTITTQKYIPARKTSANETPFYPEDRITLTSTTNLGNTLYGTTPEESDLMSGRTQADSCSTTAKGVAVTTWTTVDPVNVSVKVSEICLPTCPNIDKLYIVKVLA